MSDPAHLPVYVEQPGRHLFVSMADPAAMDAAAPFFREGLPRDARDRSMAPLAQWLPRQVAPQPDYSDISVIFQVSRCGSTLLARNIAQHEDALVLSEPPFFAALHGRFAAIEQGPAAMRVSLAMLEPWRLRAKAMGKRLVLKLSSSLNPFMPALLEAMPGARALALHREPLAVLESLDRSPSVSLRAQGERQPSALLPELRPLEEDRSLLIAADRYIRSVSAMQTAPDTVLRVDYDDLADAYPDILDHLGLDRHGGPRWSSAGDAKARWVGQAREYTPAPGERLAGFAARHADLLAIVRRHHSPMARAREARRSTLHNPIENCA
ncbi:sulfotransferase family protein [Alteriqipengyuania lutimaris]|uniref:hypothetical protein n=1 Tax=Alteriqipengyuania lutimaris TaxID=1538146 RepID=UPI0015F13A76|nr:hypothetical protein [Alteriqipengyuania lutimaris]MBB3034361.1 hypothetical protein [Alteriqipengyuania lutimaris]